MDQAQKKLPFLILPLLYSGSKPEHISLNLQYYVYLGGQKYVDLGLGTHRVKCRVHDDFK